MVKIIMADEIGLYLFPGYFCTQSCCFWLSTRSNNKCH